MIAEKANFTASVGSIDGPYSLAGDASINGSPLRLDLAVGARGANGHTADLSLQAGGGKLGFKGTLSEAQVEQRHHLVSRAARIRHDVSVREAERRDGLAVDVGYGDRPLRDRAALERRERPQGSHRDSTADPGALRTTGRAPICGHATDT